MTHGHLLVRGCTVFDNQLLVQCGGHPHATSLAIGHGLAHTHGCAIALTGQFLRLQDPDKFCASVEAEQQALRDKLVAATSRLPEVAISTDTKLKISEVPPWQCCIAEECAYAVVTPRASASHSPNNRDAGSSHPLRRVDRAAGWTLLED